MKYLPIVISSVLLSGCGGILPRPQPPAFFLHTSRNPIEVGTVVRLDLISFGLVNQVQTQWHKPSKGEIFVLLDTPYFRAPTDPGEVEIVVTVVDAVSGRHTSTHKLNVASK